MQRLRSEDGELLVDLERRFEARLTFRTDPTFKREQVVVTNLSGEEIKN